MPDTKSETLRFAPSPNGWLHPGHAYSALFTWDMARDMDARFILRIEDIDVGRCRPEYEQGIYDDLAWLGIDWEEPVRRQSEHFAEYEAALKKLRDMGLLYPCFATRKEIQDAIAQSGIPPRQWPLDPDGAPVYPGLYKDIPKRQLNELMWEGRSYCWRMDTEKACAMAEEMNGGPVTFMEEGVGSRGEHGLIRARPQAYGDVVIGRKDVPTSYHLSVTLDDALQGVTLVTRGQDLSPATHIHRVLQVLLGLPEPRWHHHELVRDEDGRRLSKTARDMGLRELRARGVTPEEVREMIGLAERA
ncbi:tRNA glutamyl-Q(34) synthetase GluQRS [Parvibaculum sp. MBR-TMA-1.3b-4.2]|jgi:glutamyl-Q tRNA(Asp) synthetase